MTRNLFALVILLALFGCDKSTNNTGTPAAAVLPQGWPVAELTLPADAQQHPIPYTRQVPKPGGKYGIEWVYPAGGGVSEQVPPSGQVTGTWEICFASNCTWTDVIQSAENNLLSGGYTKLTGKNGSSATRTLSARLYLSADKKTIVKVVQDELPMDDNSGTSTAYLYSVSCSPVPMPQDMIERVSSQQ